MGLHMTVHRDRFSSTFLCVIIDKINLVFLVLSVQNDKEVGRVRSAKDNVMTVIITLAGRLCTSMMILDLTARAALLFR